MAFGILQPDSLLSVKIAHSGQNNDHIYNTFTIAELAAIPLFANKNLVFVNKQDERVDDIYFIIIHDTAETVYIGNAEYLSNLYGGVGISTTRVDASLYCYNGSNWVNAYNYNESTQTKDGHTYYKVSTIERCPSMVWCTNFTNLYCNNSPWVPPVVYTWASVSSLTGKYGTMSLAQIASDSINDGEPVSGAAATAFSSLPDSANVGEIIDGLLPYEESVADVLVKYKIKSSVAGAFSLLKVVAKAGSIPKSVEDGDVVANLNPNKKSKVVSGLAEGTTYYFVIFAEDITGNTAQSEPKSIRTGNRPEEEPGIFEITIDTFKVPQDKDFKETITVSQA